MLVCARSAGAKEEPDEDPIRAADLMFERRAEALEAAAVQDPEHADERLREAAGIRLGLGQTAAAEADLAAREQRHRGDRARVAELFWSRRELLRSDDERLAHAELYLRRHARAGARDRRVVAEVTVGRILWDRSCRWEGFDCFSFEWTMAGGRARFRSERPLTHRLKKRGPRIPEKYRRIKPWCLWDGTFALVIVRQRDDRLAARAQEHLARALQLARAAVDVPDDAARREYGAALAIARLYRVEPALEPFLRRQAPSDLRFWPDPWLLESGTAEDARTHARQLREVGPSRRRYAAFMKAIAEEAAALRNSYAELARDEAAARLPAVFARAALVEHHYSRQLAMWNSPAGAASQQVVDDFCAEHRQLASARMATQEQLWARCVAVSVEHGGRDWTSARCEERLAQQWPERYPANDEFFGSFDRTPAWLVHFGVQTEVPVREPR